MQSIILRALMKREERDVRRLLMDKETLVRKMEDYVRAYREQLDKNDGSSLSALADNARSTFDRLKGAVMGNERARGGLESLKEHMDKLEHAVSKGDKQLSAKALTLMEEAVQNLKRKFADAEKPEKSDPPQK